MTTMAATATIISGPHESFLMAGPITRLEMMGEQPGRATAAILGCPQHRKPIRHWQSHVVGV